MSKHFTHLHCHTEFSLLDGAISLDRLIKFGKEHELRSLAITDHGNIFGAVKFFQQCKKAGIKPVLGIEAYLTEDANIKSADNKYYHLILLVQNAIGYKNLCKLISFSYQQGFYFKPRIDYAALEKYSEGLIATTACLGGHIPKLLMQGQEALADERIDWFLNTFGPERFYMEVQPEDQPEQTTLNSKLYEWSKKKQVQLVAAGDCHYPTLDDHEAHETLLCIGTHAKFDEPGRYSFGDCRTYLRTPDEMLELFKEHEEAVWNTGKIADMCEFDFETGKLFFPKFNIPEGHTSETFFRADCQSGLDRLLAEQLIPADQAPVYQDRLNLEMDLISSMGFIGYFLVVSDFIKWAHRNGIPVGPGRGSAAGSLVAWCLEITNIDPIRYNLLFERFLNPERITMPDIDIDFCIEGRERVIDYLKDHYGHDKVCQIITFGTMAAKNAIKDVARVMGFSFEDSNSITNLIPEQLKITIKESIEQEPRLKELIENNPRVKHLIDISLRLEGLTRHASKHAAGIVISPEPIDEVLPLFVPAKTTDLVTQYAMTELESLGFLKIDLLGLKNLTLIDHAVGMIKKTRGINLDILRIPLDDQAAFDLICAGKTSGVFQLESDGLKDVLRKLKPSVFEDIIAVNALYRPGPLGSGMVDDFIERKHGRQEIKYLFQELEPILQDTYGVIVYQEQVMKIASAIAGYSLGESDILRRAMGKKKADVMAEQRELFTKRAIERSFDEKKAGELFDLMAYFAGYGFNKSHSAAYALIAYQTAYLKANFAPEFMACLISLESSNAEKMAFYLQEAKDMHIDILPPDINRSEIKFSVTENKILFGLQGIKSVGLASLENILAMREKKAFNDLFDFCKRIDLRTSNKRVIEHLIWAGALDTLPGSREQKTNELATVLELAAAKKRAEITGQMDLFSATKSTDGKDELYAFAPCTKWSDKEKLEKEKEVIGFYLSAHPLESYQKQYPWLQVKAFDELLKLAQDTPLDKEIYGTGYGIIKSKREIITKKGDRMAFIQLEDLQSSCEVILFPKTFAKVSHLLDDHHTFLVKGALDLTSPHICKIKANHFIPLEQLLEDSACIEAMHLHLPNEFDEQLLTQAKNTLKPGNVPFVIRLTEHNTPIKLVTKQKVTFDKVTVDALTELNLKVTVEV
jgi:DNA polymerase-3 subunit alpha